MRTKRYKHNVESTSYDLSISDMMAALCCIFVLVCISVMVKLNGQIEKYEANNKLTSVYNDMRESLYNDLMNEFETDLDNWKAKIDKETLTITFNDPDTLFMPESAELKDLYKGILNDFFPRLVKVIYTDDYLYEIDEIRIEGHTATNRNETLDFTYKDGMRLSQERTRATLLHCLTTNLADEKFNWAKLHIAAIGYSNSRHILNDDGSENQEESRRVEFRIMTNATKVLNAIENFRE